MGLIIPQENHPKMSFRQVDFFVFFFCQFLSLFVTQEILEDVVGHQRVPPSEPHSKGGAREPTEPHRRSQQLGQRGSSPHEV